MNRPARRDGTPDRKKGNYSGRKSQSRSTSRERYERSDGDTERGSRGDRAGHSRQESTSDRYGQEPRRQHAPKNNRSGSWGDPKSARLSRDEERTAAKRKRHEMKTPAVSQARPARHQNTTAEELLRHLEETPRKKLTSLNSDGGLHQSTSERLKGVRLQKVLAQAGVASRRVAERMIDAGRVEVDGVVVREQGRRVNPENAIIRVDGSRIIVDENLVHLSLNKPRGWQSTMADEQNRPCIGDLVADRVAAGQRLFHVGRLDADTEGLIMLTNDGELAHRLMHPSYRVSKTYLATVQGKVAKNAGRRMREGIELDEGLAQVDDFHVLDTTDGRTLVRVILHEGRNRIVRRLFAEIGNPVIGLVRTKIGDVNLGNQRPGTLRKLNRQELASLYEAVGL